MGSILRLLIWLYRHTLSYFLGRTCRFDPTCSAYASEAIRLYGAWQGGKMALKRMVRCHPWGGWGYDPVPQQGTPPQGTQQGQTDRK